MELMIAGVNPSYPAPVEYPANVNKYQHDGGAKRKFSASVTRWSHVDSRLNALQAASIKIYLISNIYI